MFSIKKGEHVGNGREGTISVEINYDPFSSKSRFQLSKTGFLDFYPLACSNIFHFSEIIPT